MSEVKPYSSWLGGLWALVGLAVLCSLALPHTFLLTALGDSIQCLLLLGFCIGTAINLNKSDRRSRLFWLLMLAGASLWLGTQLLWTYFEVFLRREAPNPFVGDIVLFLHLVPFMAGMAVRPDIDRGAQGTRLGSLDFALLFSWWLYLYLFVVIPWQYVVPDSPAYGFSFDTLYFAEHVVVLAVIGTAWRSSRGQWLVYREFFLAASVYAFSSVLASVAIDFGVYYTGSFYDIPLLISMLLFTRAALMARFAPLETAVKTERKVGGWAAGAAMAVAGTLPLLALWAAFFSTASAPVRHFRLLLTLLAIVFVGGLRSWKQLALDEELDRANQELREASLTDLLTGVRNRRFLATTIDNDVRLVLRAYSPLENTPKSLNRDLIFYLVDIDHFKSINDAFGHDQGDEMLVQIAARISSAIRHSDVLIRWGGEEFLVVSRNTNRAEAEILASRILHGVGSEPFRLAGGQSIRRTCSIGWAVFPWFITAPDAVECTEILRLADRALYQAKNAGRNRAVGLVPASHTAQPAPACNAIGESGAELTTCSMVTLGPLVGNKADAGVEKG